MDRSRPTYLGNDVYIIDQREMGIPNRTVTYVIDSDHITVVDTGSSPAVPHLLEGFSQLGVQLAEIKYIIVTHIHLDHAGGAGLLMQKCPNATLVVHPRGAKHMIDPSKLIESTKSVYGDEFDQLFAPIEAVPQERVMIKDDGTSLPIGENRILEFKDTPGHAMHHCSIYDPVSRGVFSGDTIGIRYPYFEDIGISYYMPAMTPTQFNLEMMMDSWKKILDWDLDRIYFGHFGVSQNIEDVIAQLRMRTPYFVDIAKKALEMGEGETGVYRRLKETITEEWKQMGVPDEHLAYRILEFDLNLNAKGLVYSINRENKQKK